MWALQRGLALKKVGAYVRRKGYRADDAQDLTQEFFARLLARNYLNVADRNKGKFRSYPTFCAFEEWIKEITSRSTFANPSLTFSIITDSRA